jgi:cobalt-zinc-cadmium efflux system outer membrane protein
VGHTHAGEIAEQNASARRLALERERVRREIRLAMVVSLQVFESRQKERDAFTPGRLQNAEEGIDHIADQIQAARLSVRDAIVAEQALIGLLRADIEARRAAAVASVELARAVEMPIEEGRQ